ncbi:hypothetical protein CBM2633_A40108 [Cupriavidus taiwanensis]|nr:hypothetical protein CBM2604_A40032 [Cupriavidus taiwanensis]SOZ27099.1 hypothetical protein CBM2609_A50032 [Cupriavidus taiwanensis]SOZ45591.1 hypothetical protein CBM2610_A60032 [Cupriavidus taiwanensis]SOZ99577.1 hypothetical protein CBM2626_A40122 [Cupriavidus taiwanensis]SPA13350.1 hypothetical protein CBM2633_A40108 [Cupriavidus taiwanensis]
MRDSHSFFYLQLRVFDSVFVVPALALQAARLLWAAPAAAVALFCDCFCCLPFLPC